MVWDSLLAVKKQICGFGFVSGRTKADLWFWLLHKPYNDLTSRFVVMVLLFWPYNDLNSRFVVLASLLAVTQQIYGFGSLHKPYNDLNSRFLVLAPFLAVQKQI